MIRGWTLLALPAVLAAAAPVLAAADPPGAYVDALIDGGGLAPLATAGSDGGYDRSGLPRQLSVEAVGSGSWGSGGSGAEDGIEASGRIETANWGVISLDGVLRARPRGAALAITERGMPFAGGWAADSAVGTIYTEEVPLARRQYRFFLPVFPIVGASSAWRRGDGAVLEAALGEPGLFDGLTLAAFQPLSGLAFEAGAQQSWSAHWTAALQFAGIERVKGPTLSPIGFGPGPAPPLLTAPAQASGQSVFAALAWSGPDRSFQLNALESGVNGQGAAGVWFDGQARLGRVAHNFGAFWLQPDLNWAYLPLGGDSAGVYWRADYQSQRWLLDGGLEAARSLSGRGLAGALFSGDVRHELEPGLAIGASGSLRLTSSSAGEAALFVEGPDRLGQWRAQAQETAENGYRLDRISLEETFGLGPGQELMASVSGTRETGSQGRAMGLGAAISGGGALIGPASWTGALTYDAITGAGSSGNLSVDLGLAVRLGERWSLLATWFDNRDQSAELFALTPLVGAPPTPVVTRSGAAFLTLKYDMAAGSAPEVVGGSPGAGAGAIRGCVFLDTRGEGVRTAADPGAANLTVLLDGILAAHTGADGSFAFGLVGPGEHKITVLPDNLPLPWVLEHGGERSVVVRARAVAQAQIAAERAPA